MDALPVAQLHEGNSKQRPNGGNYPVASYFLNPLTGILKKGILHPSCQLNEGNSKQRPNGGNYPVASYFLNPLTGILKKGILHPSCQLSDANINTLQHNVAMQLQPFHYYYYYKRQTLCAVR